MINDASHNARRDAEHRSQLPSAAETTTAAAGETHRPTAASACLPAILPACLLLVLLALIYLVFLLPKPIRLLSLPDFLVRAASRDGILKEQRQARCRGLMQHVSALLPRVAPTLAKAVGARGLGAPRRGPEQPRPGAPCETTCASTALWHAALT